MKMKWNLVIAFVVLAVAVFGPLVAAQHQERSIGNGSYDRSRDASGRMISTSGKGNAVKQDEEDHDHGNSDSAFDNGPTPGRDSSEITFPIDDFYHPPDPPQQQQQQHPHVAGRNLTEGKRWKTIPLNALVKFGTEANIAKFFKTYVKNTMIVKDNDTFEEYLADSQGKPILDTKSEKVVVTPPRFEPTLRFQSVNYPGFPNGVKGRTGTMIEARAKSNVDLAMTRGDKQPKSSISLPVCSPEVTTVPVPLDSLKVDPSMLVIPKCLKVERCGGCCLSDLTVCEPETKETVKYTVTLLGYDGDNEGSNPQLQFVNTTTVEIEQHKSCKCKCRTKKEHCRSHHHKYEVSQCSCICMNIEAHQNCLDSPGNRFWDHETCQCTCQDVKACSSGYYFDLNTCDCQRQPSEFEMRSMKALAFNRSRATKQATRG